MCKMKDVIEHHPLLTFLDRHLLDVGKERHGYDDCASVGQTNDHLSTMRLEVQVPDSYVDIFHLTHIAVLLFFTFQM